VSQAQNRYKVDLREIRFLLFEQLKLGELLGKEPFAAWGQDEADMILAEVARYATEVSGPLNAVGDRAGCTLENGQVKAPPGFKEAWKRLYADGWKQIAAPSEHGGQDAPFTLHALVEELLAGSNAAFSMYPGLTYGVGEVVHAFGTKEQKARYAANLFNGKWAGTMCLTEPQAGSDVGSAKTTAKKLADGTYAIKGTKIFISAGDHDLTENIVHLVLARIDQSIPGTKGLSLFIVPKYRVNADGSVGAPNDVQTGSIEHKLGINGSATAVLNFGDNDGCVGELVGTEENVGMAQMFKMMNGARIGVALQGIGVASTAYLNALEYAKERKQGSHFTRWKDANAPRVAIIEHPDVRRMLLDMKARVEGIRALIYKLAAHHDRAEAAQGKDDKLAAYHKSQVELLTPIIKAYSSDQAFRICETAIQTFGGAGFLKDWPIEQYLRDSKIFSIYEGTNHIQAMDLVGRKLGQSGGEGFRAFLGDIGKFVAQNAQHAQLGADVAALGKASETLGGAAMQLFGWSQNPDKLALVPLNATRFLEMMAEVSVAWMLLEAATIATAASDKLPEGHADRAFYAGKVHAARHYARTALPGVTSKLKAMQVEDQSAMAIPDEAFATA
jgi:hypothetical protein